MDATASSLIIIIVTTRMHWEHMIEQEGGFRRAWDVRLHTFHKIMLYIMVINSETIENDSRKICIWLQIFLFKT
jgi:hypothetical protein